MSHQELDQILSIHCAPVLLGCKIANLVSIKKDPDCSHELFPEEYRTFLARQNIETRILCSCPERYQLFLYRPDLLLRSLHAASAQEILVASGYPAHAALPQYLDILSQRMKDKQDFPHEIGLFLGYPAEDVRGFWENRGRNFLLSRYWKVYSHAEEALRLFERFDRCRDYLCRRLQEGFTLSQILAPESCVCTAEGSLLIQTDPGCRKPCA